jgi:hypothetical protein
MDPVMIFEEVLDFGVEFRARLVGIWIQDIDKSVSRNR